MKRGNELKPLSWDHHHGLVLALRLKKGIEKKTADAVMADYILYVWQNSLQRHFDKEEDLFVEPLKKYSAEGTELSKRLLKEHAFFRELVIKIERQNKNMSAQIRDFGMLLEKHIRFEERDLFPAAERNIPPKVLQEIGRSLHTWYQSSDICWTPEFWV